MPHLPESIAFVLVLTVGCGAGAAQSSAPAAGDDAVEALSEDSTALDPVAPGEYRLEMSATCGARDLTAQGTLRLSPISPAPEGSSSVSDGTLLWGQTDLDLAQFARCLGQSPTAPGDPIHPGVLVEVLRYDGVRHHQVLLVSTDAETGAGRADGARASGGVAMWVERVESGHLAGVWSRWELMGKGEGRWSAERVERTR